MKVGISLEFIDLLCQTVGKASLTTAEPIATNILANTRVTWTVTDIHGNSSQDTQDITITDNEDPTITVAADQTQTADAGSCDAAVTVVGPVTGDNCGVQSVVNDYNSTSDASGTYPVGTTTITWTVTDCLLYTSDAADE